EPPICALREPPSLERLLRQPSPVHVPPQPYMAKPKPHPQSPWVPYQNLLAYFLARGSSLKEARKLARAHVALAFPGDGATPSWRKPPAEVVAAAQAWEITEPLRSLLRGRRPEARLRLDRLLLA